MNKEELEIAKRIAEIECVELTRHMNGFLYKNSQGYMCVNGVTMGWYNPFEWAILGPLMVKYRVEPDYDCMYVQIYNSPTDHVTEHFEGQEEIPRAILKCIITSKG